ncbi:MAG: hypothetical protein SGPRY_006578, partial [Prymnesium sp.]
MLQHQACVFEESLGLLISCCLEHVEAVQMTDLSELASHVHDVLVSEYRPTP